MKVLIVIKRSPPQRFLVELHTTQLVKEVAALLGKRKNSQAIVRALTKGRFEKEIPEGDMASVKADVLITEESAHWDLTERFNM